MHAHVHVHACVHAYLFPTHARTQAKITRTPLSCGGHECDAYSLSLLRQSHTNMYTCVCVCVDVFLFCFVSFLSTPDSCLPNSLFLLDTGILH
jgi:hypothetical protein